MIHISHQKFLWLVQYTTGFHPIPVAPSRADGASLDLSQTYKRMEACCFYKSLSLLARELLMQIVAQGL